MMNVSNVNVFDLEQSIVASGLPMREEYNGIEYSISVSELAESIKSGTQNENNDFKRAVKLANNPSGSGHCNFLSGILVSFNVTGTQVWWMQAERYHFLQIVSSQSKMHRAKKMFFRNTCNEKTDNIAITSATTMQNECNCGNCDFEEFVYSIPMGFELTARCTTNYLQLKTIWNQRHEHKLQEWRDFCSWIESLPFAKELITGEGNK